MDKGESGIIYCAITITCPTEPVVGELIAAALLQREGGGGL